MRTTLPLAALGLLLVLSAPALALPASAPPATHSDGIAPSPVLTVASRTASAHRRHAHRHLAASRTTSPAL